MPGSMPVLNIITSHNTPGTEPPLHWHLIDWEAANRSVKLLQRRIVKALKAGKWKKVRDLQRLLTNSYSAKVLAIRRVTENTGRNTSGIDGKLWKKPEDKFKAISQLTTKGYQAQAVRRVKIPKSNGKWRSLGIPTMTDRAMQALYLLALEPVCETLADHHSYGFRPYRRCADAIARCFQLLSRKVSPCWILEGDIKGCFDHISHKWLLENIPMDKKVLKQWLQAGYFEKQRLFATEQGTPQGSVISPTLANMVLDGMERAIDLACGINRQNRNSNPFKIHLVRYADDFIVTASNRNILECIIKPAIKVFLKERGLELSEEKTHLTHIDTGFNFLGQHLRKYSGKLLIMPSKEGIHIFLNKVQQVIHKHRTNKTTNLLYKLNPIIRGWALYHKHVVSKKAFSYVDYRIYWMIWRWAKRRHPNKSTSWIKRRYFIQHNGCQNVLHAFDEGNLLTLFKAAWIPIQRHIKIRSKANPYDVEDELYFEKRSDDIMLNKLHGRRLLTIIFRRQQGRCTLCQQKITAQTAWHAHHLIPKHLGGKYSLKNICLLHPVCHRQVHAQNFQLPSPRLKSKR